MSADLDNRFGKFFTACAMAQDAMQRCCDGIGGEDWKNGTLRYSQQQLLRANRKIIDALEIMNAHLEAVRLEEIPTLFEEEQPAETPSVVG